MRNVAVSKILSVCTLAMAVALMAFTPAEPADVSQAGRVETSGQVGRNDWQNLITEAQREGSLVSYADMIPQAKDAVRTAFSAKFGINVEWVSGRAAELVTKIKAEKGAGLDLVDFAFLGAPSLVIDVKPMGITVPVGSMLLLPEVRDPNNWQGGQLPFVDKEQTGFRVVQFASSFYQRNVDLVKEGEITTSLDLLNPNWKEKIVMSDPGVDGASNSWFTWMVTGVLGREKGLQFMKDLAAQNPMVTRDQRQMVEWVARGKYHISIAPSMSVAGDFVRMGAPFAFIDVKEPRRLNSGYGIICVFKKAPHPNATKLFVNWLLSMEGSAVFARATQYASTRVDVPPEGILPIMVPRPGDVCPEADENYIPLEGEMRKAAAGIFGQSK
jgi:iron(III) transport system substrate-binding protein